MEHEQPFCNLSTNFVKYTRFIVQNLCITLIAYYIACKIKIKCTIKMCM